MRMCPSTFNGLNPRHPGTMPLALDLEQLAHPFSFVAREQEALRQDQFTDTAPAVAAGVNNRVARRVTLLMEMDANPCGNSSRADRHEWDFAFVLLAPPNI
jgi:hypothetical protein